MKKFVVIILLILALIVGCSNEATEPDLEKYEGSMEEIAQHFVKDFSEKKVDSLIERYNFTPQVEAVVNRMLFVEVYVQIENVNDEFVEIGAKRNSTISGNQVVSYELLYTEGAIELNIVFDNENRIAGFNYNQIKEKVEYSKDIISEEVSFGLSEFLIEGTVVYPKEEGVFKAVVLIPGSGPTDRDSTLYGNAPLKDIAMGLAEKGIASLRFDKRTYLHAPRIDVETFTPYEEYIEDVIAAFNLMKDNSRIDENEIYLLGHSQGGNLIPAFAQEVDAAGYVIIAGNVTPLHELVVYQTEYIANLDSRVTKEEEEAIETYKKIRDNVRNLNPDSNMTSDDLMGISKDYWMYIKNYDPIELGKKIDKKMLIVAGSRDYQVPLSELELWREGLSAKENISFKVYEGMNHLLYMGEGPSSPQEYMTPGNADSELIEDIADWIKH